MNGEEEENIHNAIIRENRDWINKNDRNAQIKTTQVQLKS